MEIELKDNITVSQEEEKHFKLLVNGNEICVSIYKKFDEFGCESDIEIFKGKELLTEEEQEEVIEYIENL